MCLSKRNLHRYIMGMVKLKAFYLPWVRMALFTSFCKSKIPNPSYEQIESPSFVNVLSLLKDKAYCPNIIYRKRVGVSLPKACDVSLEKRVRIPP